jgi:hypothetical protein
MPDDRDAAVRQLFGGRPNPLFGPGRLAVGSPTQTEAGLDYLVGEPPITARMPLLGSLGPEAGYIYGRLPSEPADRRDVLLPSPRVDPANMPIVKWQPEDRLFGDLSRREVEGALELDRDTETAFTKIGFQNSPRWMMTRSMFGQPDPETQWLQQLYGFGF